MNFFKNKWERMPYSGGNNQTQTVGRNVGWHDVNEGGGMAAAAGERQVWCVGLKYSVVDAAMDGKRRQGRR